MLFCIIDTETTGLNPKYHEVIQVATIMCDASLEEIGRTSFRIQPQNIERASQRALEINGYNPRTWDTAFHSHGSALMHLNNFVNKFLKESEEIVVTGQNISFDMNFLINAYSVAGVLNPFSYNTLDLIDVVKAWEKVNGYRLERRSLKYLSEYTGCINTKPHDAEADAEVTLEILKWFIDGLKKESSNVRKTIRKSTKIKI